MPHADSSIVPPSIVTKPEFWLHVHAQLDSLLAGQRNWVTNLANASSLIYHSFPRDRGVNWCGFYVSSRLFPSPSLRGTMDHASESESESSSPTKLLLGPFCGKPACQFINVTPGKARGVCADAFLQHKTLMVPEVDLYPGHIACDGETRSEIVCPLILPHGDGEIVVGVMDLDCLAIAGFDEEDQMGLQKIAELIVNACDW